MSDLKPCPFCGGCPIWGIGCHVDNTPYAYRVECQKCKRVTPFYPTREEAIEAWNRRVDDHFRDATKMVERMAVPNNKVHLCDFCKHSYPVCPAEMNDVIFGNGKGQDNICACAKFEIKPERTAKVYQKQAPDNGRILGVTKRVCAHHAEEAFMTMQNTVTSADADWSGMSEDETVTNRNALKPERSRTFLEIVVSYPVFCAYPEYEGKPYYTIKYEEKGETIIGFGTYKPEVLSQYLRQYFLSSAEPEQKWIPVTERLPEDNRQVLVYAQSTHFALAKYDEMRKADGKYRKQWVTFDAWKPFYTIKNVIAWMPLPEPWRGE